MEGKREWFEMTGDRLLQGEGREGVMGGVAWLGHGEAAGCKYS